MEDNRITEIIEMVKNLAKGDYSSKALASAKNDQIDSLAGHLNHLAEVLAEKAKETIRIADDQIWAMEGLKACTEEFGNYLDLFEKQKEKEKELAAKAATAEAERKRAAELEEACHKLENSNQELKEATSQLIQSAKLAALGELTAGVAHELNQPLNVMKIISQSILRDIQKGLFEQKTAEEELPEIINQINKMAAIVDHMRVFTRRTAGEIKESIDLNEVVEDAFKFFNQQLKTHNIEIIQVLHPKLSKIRGDSIRLEQIILNLVSNAKDAIETNKNGVKKIEIKTYNLGTEQAVGFEIKDSGDGIPENIKEKIFQPFFTTKEPGKGTGLGLSVASKIMEEHKGRIELESVAGESTTFRLIFPAIGATND